MNLQRFFLFVLTVGTLLSLSPGFTSCTDDDDNTLAPHLRPSTRAAGTYGGSNSIATKSPNKTFELGSVQGQHVVIMPQSPNTVSLTLSPYSMSIDEGTAPYALVGSKAFEVKNIGITAADNGTLSISGNVKGSVSMQLVRRGANAGETPFRNYEVNTGTLAGTIAPNGSLSLTLSFQPGSMPMPIVYTIQAQR